MIFVGACFPIEARWIQRGDRVRIVRLPMGERAPSGLIGQAMDGASDWLLSAGFSGGLDPKLRAGDVVIASAIRHREDEIKIDEQILARVRSALADAGRSVDVGTVVCTDHVVPSTEKRSLGQAGALAVDMETGPLARWADERKVRFLVVRSILDTVDQSVTFDGEASIWRSLIRRPGSAVVLGYRAFLAGRSLGGAVNVVTETLQREAGR